MQIIFSPSKEMRYEDLEKNKINIKFNSEKIFSDEKIFFTEKTTKILNEIKKIQKEEFEKMFKVKNKTLEKTFENYTYYEKLKEFPAIYLYNGVSFKELDIENYTEESFIFMCKHIFILSAFYGVLSPNTLIKPYRLDFSINIFFDNNLYNFWKQEINLFFKNNLKLNTNNENFILNLASNEFSKILDRKNFKIIDVEFYEMDEEKNLKNVSTYSKQARGSFLNFIVKYQIESLEEMKKFKEKNYKYNKKLSSKEKLVFIR